MTAPLRAAIIGCGSIAGGLDEAPPADAVRTHVRAYLQNPKIQLVGVADADKDKAEAFARRWGIAKSYADPEALLRQERPDIVSICTPNETHTLFLELCAARGIKGVWCEKPLGIDDGAARRALESCRASGTKVAVNYMRRWLDESLAVKKALADGSLGRILSVHGLYTKGLRHNGSHTLDLLRDWFGEPLQAQALGRTDRLPEDHPLTVLLRFPGDIEAVVVGLPDCGYGVWELDMLAERGRVRFRDGGASVDWFKIEPSALFPGYQNLSPKPRTAASNLMTVMREVLDDLVAAVETGAPLRSDGFSGLKTLELCNTLLRSSHEQTRASGR